MIPMKKVLLLLVLIAPLFIISCQKDEIQPVTGPTFDEKARDALSDLMDEWYYWYRQLQPVKITDYDNPYELLNALRYKPLDRWSFVADYDSFISSMQGSFVGHGIRMGLDPSGNVRIVMIYKNSPLYSKGVRRGWIIKKINGTEAAPVFTSGDVTAYNNLIGPATAGVTNTFLFQIPDGRDSVISSTKASFQVNSVLKYDTLHLKSGVTGYLVFDEFIEPSANELKTAFAFFYQNNIKDIILDLRYNSGGILDVANDLASYIAGSSKFSTPFVRSEFNDKKASNNATTNFKPVLYPVNMTRLVVITTRETASASEVVINGLKPHMTVVTVGDTTNGKPTGMNVWGYANKYIFAPITFKLTNSAFQGDFFDGFAPSKYVTDDITHDWGDRNEFCIKEAIRYIETGSFSAKSAYIYKPTVLYSERQGLMNNTYVIDKRSINR